MLDKVRMGFRFRARRLDTVRRLLWLPLAGAALVALLLCSAQAGTPVIYCTDLFHPQVDPDDHFDLITLFSLPELEVKAILLDQGRKQLEQPGSVPVNQVFKLFNKSVPVAIGLANKLKTPNDNGRDQEGQFQAAIGLLLTTLSNSPQPVVIFATGSTRDLCAARNREPDLFRRKVSRLYLNIGNADPAGSEYNVDLDPQAYRGLLQSGLPVYLCPCLPMSREGTGAVYSTWWKFRQGAVLTTAGRGLQNFFTYALQRPAPAELDPIAALSADLRPWHHLVWDMERNMWCTAPFVHAAGRTLRKEGEHWKLAPKEPDHTSQGGDIFTFVPAEVEVGENARTTINETAPTPNMQVFKVLRPADYAPALTDCLRELFSSR